MTCAERRDELLAYALGALDADERSALEAHLAGGCPACAGHLAEARAVVAHLPLAMPAVPPPAAVRRTLIDRAERAASVAASGGGRLLRFGHDWGRPLAAAALAAAALLVAVVLPLSQSQAELAASMAAQRATIERLRGELAGAMQAVRLLESRQLELNVLASTSGRQETWARLLRDESDGVWQLYAFGLEPLPPGRTYELWFITADDRKIPAGTFDAAADGRASHRVGVPAGLAGIVAAAVTDEPAGGSPQPTGEIRLIASL